MWPILKFQEIDLNGFSSLHALGLNDPSGIKKEKKIMRREISFVHSLIHSFTMSYDEEKCEYNAKLTTVKGSTNLLL